MKEEPLTVEELQLFSRRDLIIRSIIGLPFAGIIWRLWDLQIKNGEKYADLSQGNRIRITSEPAPRGIIYDRNNEILVKNIPTYSLYLTREDTKDIDAVLEKISITLKIPVDRMKAALKQYRRIAKFHPIEIYENLTFRQVSLIGTYKEEFPGINIKVIPKRYYPIQRTGAHVLGYMSQITKQQLKNLPQDKIQSAKRIGQKGLELIYNDELIGNDGGRQIEVDNSGREIKSYPNPITAKPGNDVVSTIDSRLQIKIEEIMGDRKGAVVVMNPMNGEVLAMVSLPSFDPNEFSQGLSAARWRELKNDPADTLNNKCIQGKYSPGSTFKMAIATAALEEGLIDEFTEFNCDGHIRVGKNRFHCWKRTGHGKMNVITALENSCNVFFFKIALELGVDTISSYAKRLGLGLPTGVDLNHEIGALIPNKKWYEQRFSQNWLVGETANVAIGQGFVSVTPIQLANYISVFANDGYLTKPRLVKEVINVIKTEDNQFHKETKSIPIVKNNTLLSPSTLAIVRRGMEENVRGENGTGKHAFSKLLSIAGKTGTTQVVSIKTRDKMLREHGEIDEKYFDHAWFAAYAPVNRPRIASAVLLENGRSGKNAARLTKQIYEYYVTHIDSSPLRDLFNGPVSLPEIG